MVGIVLVTHGNLGDEFIRVSSKIYGQPRQVLSVPILPDDGKSIAKDKLLKAIQEADTGDGVLILTDGFGGSPSNLCLSIFQGINCEIITGLNLSMLLEVLCYRDRLGLQDLSKKAESGGQRGIVNASDIFRKKLVQGDLKS